MGSLEERVENMDDRGVLVEIVKSARNISSKIQFPSVMSGFFQIATRLDDDDDLLKIHVLAVLMSGHVDKLSRIYPDLMKYLVEKLLESSRKEEKDLLCLLYAERPLLIPSEHEAIKLVSLKNNDENEEINTTCFVFFKISIVLILVSLLTAYFFGYDENNDDRNLRGLSACAAVIICVVALIYTTSTKRYVSNARRRKLLETVLGVSLNDIATKYVPPPKNKNVKTKRKGPEITFRLLNTRTRKKKNSVSKEKQQQQQQQRDLTLEIGMYKDQINALESLKQNAKASGVANVPLSEDIMKSASELESMIQKSGVSNNQTKSFQRSLEFLRKQKKK